MFARAHSKIGSVIGLFAILMATLAPTISHIVAASRRADTVCAVHSMHMQSMGPMHDMARMHMAHMMHMMHESNVCTNDSTPHSATTHGDDCGYCSLFAHTPAVPTIAIPFSAIAWAIEHCKAMRFESIRRHEPLTSSQPRAPPVSS
ncbi:DUF2946 domain-containing protein [Trinickia sp. EG282A]|uniref:DUF2946 domain-containing protein n=1 Tax=Trinickia sp. EG282A TaxID=3237013 RepID=UPI0034D26367